MLSKFLCKLPRRSEVTRALQWKWASPAETGLLHTRAYNSSAASYRRGGGLHERSRQLHRWGARTYRRTRERTHGGLRERPLTPDLLRHPSLTYVLHQLFHLLSARLNTLIVMLTFTCQVWAFKYIFGSVLVSHTFLLCDIFDRF